MVRLRNKKSLARRTLPIPLCQYCPSLALEKDQTVKLVLGFRLMQSHVRKDFYILLSVLFTRCVFTHVYPGEVIVNVHSTNQANPDKTDAGR